VLSPHSPSTAFNVPSAPPMHSINQPYPPPYSPQAPYQYQGIIQFFAIFWMLTSSPRETTPRNSRLQCTSTNVFSLSMLSSYKFSQIRLPISSNYNSRSRNSRRKTTLLSLVLVSQILAIKTHIWKDSFWGSVFISLGLLAAFGYAVAVIITPEEPE
jgi:hypothetical protein